MLDLIKKIITWILVVLIIILLMVLVSKWINKNDSKEKLSNNKNSGVRTIVDVKEPEDDQTDEFTDSKETELISDENEVNTKEETQGDNQVVDVVDTKTSAGTSILLGLITISSATYYIYSKSLEKDS